MHAKCAVEMLKPKPKSNNAVRMSAEETAVSTWTSFCSPGGPGELNQANDPLNISQLSARLTEQPPGQWQRRHMTQIFLSGDDRAQNRANKKKDCYYSPGGLKRNSSEC